MVGFRITGKEWARRVRKAKISKMLGEEILVCKAMAQSLVEHVEIWDLEQ